MMTPETQEILVTQEIQVIAVTQAILAIPGIYWQFSISVLIL